MNVGKMQIKGVTMATSHESTSPGTCHTDPSVENEENKRTYPKSDPRSFEEPRGRWGGGGGGGGEEQKAKKLQRQLEASHEGKTTWQWLECATQSPADSRKSHS